MLEIFPIVVIPLIVIFYRSDQRRIDQLIVDFGFNFQKIFRDGEYYRFLTSLFIHQSWIHFGVCLYSLYCMCWYFEKLLYDSNRLFVLLLQLMGTLFIVSWIVWKIIIQVNETLKNGFGRRNYFGLCEFILAWQVYFYCQYGIITAAMKIQMFIMLFVSDLSFNLIGYVTGFIFYIIINNVEAVTDSKWSYVLGIILGIYFLKSIKIFIVNCLESIGNLLKFFARVIGGQDYVPTGHTHQL